MSIESNKEIVLQFYQAFDDRDINKAFELLSADFIAHMAGIPEPLDREKFKQFGMEFYSAFLNSQHKFQQIIVEKDKVVTWGKFTAIHLGNFQGIPPTNKQIEISIVHIDKVENNKIIEHWGQGDVQGLMQQLGIFFLPSPKLIFNTVKNILIKPFVK